MRFRDGRCRRCERPAGIARRAAAEVSFYENHARKKKKRKQSRFLMYTYIFFHALRAFAETERRSLLSGWGALDCGVQEGGGEPQRSAV